MPEARSVNALRPAIAQATMEAIPRAMIKAGRRDLTPDVDAPSALAAVSRHFKNEDGSYRPLVIRKPEGQVRSVEFAVPDGSSDNEAGKIIRDAIAGALEETLNNAGAGSVEEARQYAKEIAMLIADGSLKQGYVTAAQSSCDGLDANPEVRGFLYEHRPACKVMSM